ncbi:MAG: spermidine synthase [Planctomycetota bacterium]
MTAVPNTARNGGFAAASAGVILASAFLLFQVQPVISKVILPWFGGSPAVWTTCMLFFQVLLLGGYAYAHWLSQSPSAARQAAVHVGLLFVAIVLLPIVPGEHWKPTDSVHPTSRILWLLTAHVGLPYFALSATGPLVQAWFGRVCVGRSPYWLYALSNFGSLAALLSYPFVFEPLITTRGQGLLWSVSFALFGIACGALTIRAWRNAVDLPDHERADSQATVGAANAASVGKEADSMPPPLDRLMWLFLPALASVGLLAITNHLCQDVAVVPFMWVAPLSLYLLSFILCFGASWWYSRRLYVLLAIGSIAFVCALQTHDSLAKLVEYLKAEPWLRQMETFVFYAAEKLGARGLLDRIGLEGLTTNELNECIVTHALAYLIALFSICMLCHGEMVRRRPATRHLTSFYLMTSAGGALGGITIALVCPAVFSTYLELNLMLCAAYLVAMVALAAVIVAAFRSGGRSLYWSLPPAIAWSLLAVVGGGGAVLVGRAQFEAFDTNDLATARSFYGVLHVEEEHADNPEYHGRELLNGRILHGYQFLADHRRRIPTTYYTRRSGAGVAVETLRKIAAGDFGPNAGGLFAPDMSGFENDEPNDEEDGDLGNGEADPSESRAGESDETDSKEGASQATESKATESKETESEGGDGGEGKARTVRLFADLFQEDAAMSDSPSDFEGKHPLRIAVVGLGVGTMAAYGERGDLVKFYEINPQVEQIARRHFSYLADTPAEVQVVIGDARLSMEREDPQQYDLIVLDAFSGDAIPVHLLTLEAIRIYQRHLKPTGVIAIHVSNRHLDLVPVVGTLAKETEMYVVKVPNGQETGAMECTSDWMLVTGSAEFASHPRILGCSHTLDDRDTQGPLWTDQFSNLLRIVK